MFRNKKLALFAVLTLVISMVLGSCAPAATPTPQIIIQKETQIIEKPVEVIVQPTPVPVTRTGAWLDSVIVVEEPSGPAAISRLETKDIDAFWYSDSSSADFKRVQANPNLKYYLAYGSYNELSFNPVGPTFPTTGKLNPFSVAAVREAMNWLIDREYIAQEIMGGLAVARWHAFNTASGDYAKLADVARKLELKYAYNKDKAKAVIDAEMTKLGATLSGGKWQFNGAPVEISVLIRTEDERRAIGDYTAKQLEDIGFTCIRDYKTSAEASPIWLGGNPADGRFHCGKTTIPYQSLAGAV